MKNTFYLLLVLFSLNAYSQNQKPVAVDDYFTFERSEDFYIDPLANDYDPEGDSFIMFGLPKIISPANLADPYLYSAGNKGFYCNAGPYYYGKLIIQYRIVPATFPNHFIDTGYIYIDILFRQIGGYDSLDVNNLNVGFVTGGDLFTDLFYPHFRTKGDKANALFKGHLWMGGYDDGGNLSVAAQTYRQQYSMDYEVGPVKGYRNAGFYERYNRLWKLNATDIIDHAKNYSQPGYVMNGAIQNWPDKGKASYQEPSKLAPYLDVNNNGRYDPENGDCPCMIGDQMIYSIFNDNIVHTETGANSLGFEIHAKMYAYKRDNIPSLNNTIFISYDIINRSDTTYDKLYFGKWLDFDLGWAYDDYVGCDSQLHAYFVFNGDNYDSSGYGNNPPAAGVTFLNHDLSGFMFYNNDWSLKGNPSEGIHFYHYLTSRFKNGQQMRYGGDGFNNAWADSLINYMYPSDPSDSNGWSEITNGNTPSDRRGIGSTGEYTMSPGDTFHFDVAYVFARDKTKNNLENLDLLKTYISEVRGFYKNNPPKCRSLKSISTEPIINNNNMLVYPNPARDFIMINGNTHMVDRINIYAVDGKVLMSVEASSTKQRVDISRLQYGTYILQLITDQGVFRYKLVKK